MNEPLVSVVVPSYNRGDVIAETLRSALAQTWPRLEIIVVDDGSTDGTAAAVAPFGDRVVYLRQDNQGLAAARNAGLRRATGEYVAWLDSDDLWNPDKIALQLAWMRPHPEYVVIASDFSAFDEAGYFELSHLRSYYAVIDRTPGGLAGIFPEQHRLEAGDPPVSVRIYGGNIYDRLIGGNCLHPPTVLFRRDAAMRAGLLDAGFRRDVDYEYLLRLSREGKVAFIDRPLMRYRLSTDQMSSDRHLAEIAISRVLVLESLMRRDPALLSRRAFRRRLGLSHLAAAHALADAERVPALRHLLTSLRWAYADTYTARTVAKLCLPRFVVERYRKGRELVS